MDRILLKIRLSIWGSTLNMYIPVVLIKILLVLLEYKMIKKWK